MYLLSLLTVFWMVVGWTSGVRLPLTLPLINRLQINEESVFITDQEVIHLKVQVFSAFRDKMMTIQLTPTVSHLHCQSQANFMNDTLAFPTTFVQCTDEACQQPMDVYVFNDTLKQRQKKTEFRGNHLLVTLTCSSKTQVIPQTIQLDLLLKVHHDVLPETMRDEYYELDLTELSPDGTPRHPLMGYLFKPVHLPFEPEEYLGIPVTLNMSLDTEYLRINRAVYPISTWTSKCTQDHIVTYDFDKDA
ncbi:hypothetical protein HMI55_000127 [Coelomomyces lativittatus]|nr:hypothetical protein HMI55_000127 [Coelomomyces lativittatus]